MLAAVDLNDNPALVAGEVGKIRTNRRLAAKVMLLEWRLSQMLPEFLFGFRHITTQRASPRHAPVNRTQHSLWHAPPTPDPTPPRASRAEGGEQRRLP